MSPVADVNVAYAAFDINHHSQPNFRPGGMQLQVWNNNEPLLNDNDPVVDTLRHQGETIRWPQQMSLNDGVQTFAITDGTSDTWGAFGGGERLRASVGTSLANFNNYNSSVSVANSGVGFAGNRVQSLVLKRVRKYSAAGLIGEDSSAKVGFPHEGRLPTRVVAASTGRGVGALHNAFPKAFTCVVAIGSQLLQGSLPCDLRKKVVIGIPSP